MFKKHITFQILYIIVFPLCPASLKRIIFYKAPPSDKRSLLWLANWPSALWLAENHKHMSEMWRPLIASFSFQVSFISSSLKGEQSRVTDTVMMLVCICSTQAAVKTISDRLYTTLWCDPVPHTHTRRVMCKTPHLNSQ